MIVQCNLIRNFLVGDGYLAVPTTAHLYSLWIVTLLDAAVVRAVFSSLEEEVVSFRQECQAVPSYVRSVNRHFI